MEENKPDLMKLFGLNEINLSTPKKLLDPDPYVYGNQHDIPIANAYNASLFRQELSSLTPGAQRLICNMSNQIIKLANENATLKRTVGVAFRMLEEAKKGK